MRHRYRFERTALAALCASAFVTGCLLSVHAEETEENKPPGMSDFEWEKIKAKRPMPFDSGPASIDVSGYSHKMRTIYRDVFSTKCAYCHTLARPINSTFIEPEEWERYVKRMVKKPGSNIDPVSARKIYEFLIYDTSIRKNK